MKLILSPIDTTEKLELNDVEVCCNMGNTLAVVFTDGRVRNYPLTHLWYYESRVAENRSKPPIG